MDFCSPPAFSFFLLVLTSSSLRRSSVWRCFSQSEEAAESFFMDPCPYSRLWASAFCWARLRFLSLALDQQKARQLTSHKHGKGSDLRAN